MTAGPTPVPVRGGLLDLPGVAELGPSCSVHWDQFEEREEAPSSDQAGCHWEGYRRIPGSSELGLSLYGFLEVVRQQVPPESAYNRP